MPSHAVCPLANESVLIFSQKSSPWLRLECQYSHPWTQDPSGLSKGILALRCNLRSTSRINKSLPWWQIPPFTSSPINANFSLMGSLFCLFHLVQARSKQEKKPKEPPSIVHGMDSGILFPPVLLKPKSANFGVLNGPQNGWAAGGSSHGQEAFFSAHRQTCCAGKNSGNFRLSPLGLPDGPSDSNEQRARLVHTYKWRSQLRIHP